MIKIGAILYKLILFFGIIRVGLGAFVASYDDAAERAFLAARYLSNNSSGAAIDQGLVLIVLGIAMGLLVKIAKKNL